MAERYYCPEPPVAGRFTLGPEESRHLARVKRVGVGEIVELFDGHGLGYRAEVQKLGKDRVELGLVMTLPKQASRVDLTLATTVPKGDRFDWLIEKATELGVSRLTPLITERSTVDPRSAKMERLRRSIVEASKQCGRYQLMQLDEPIRWRQFLTRTRQFEAEACRLLAHPGGVSLGRVIIEPGQSILVAIGPEGGFSAEEVESARELDWTIVSLSPWILRIETAGIAACALLAGHALES